MASEAQREARNRWNRGHPELMRKYARRAYWKRLQNTQVSMFPDLSKPKEIQQELL